MKKLVLFVLMLLPMCSSVSAHGQNKAEFREKFLELTDTLTTEEKDSLFSILNSVTLDFIDYNLNEGSYCQALEFIDSIQGNWKYLTGQDVSIPIYLKRALVLVQFEEWEKLSSKIMESASPFNPQNRLVLRRLIAPAQPVEFDKSGRLSIPQSLRMYASLDKECVLLGINKYIL